MNVATFNFHILVTVQAEQPLYWALARAPVYFRPHDHPPKWQPQIFIRARTFPNDVVESMLIWEAGEFNESSDAIGRHPMSNCGFDITNSNGASHLLFSFETFRLVAVCEFFEYSMV